MAWELKFALRGDLRRQMAQEVAAAEIAVTAVTRSKGKAIRNGIARQIKRAGFERRQGGAPLDQTVRFKLFPQRGRSINAAGIVSSKATYQRRSGTVDLIEVFSQGRVVRSSQGKFLAIPTKDAPLARSGRRKASPGEVNFKTAVIPTGNRKVLAVIDARTRGRAGAEPKILWLLVPNVRLGKRIDPQKVVGRLTANYAQQIVARWEREASKRNLAV